ESAKALERQKNIYTKDGVFTEGMLNWISGYLKKFNDRNIREEIGDDEDKIMELVNRFFYCG
ncbi:MAG: glutamine synthetase, partial [Bacteroidales bacterium]|nr:glutamine synthetase [Bacteroidales bacterium]